MPLSPFTPGPFSLLSPFGARKRIGIMQRLINAGTLKGWYDPTDASSYTLTSGKVSTLNDKSGNGYHLTQPTAGTRPTISAASLNGYDTLLWGGAQNLANASYANLVVPYTVFVVLRSTSSTGTNQDYITGNSGGNRYVIYTENASGKISSFAGAALNSTVDGVSATWHIIKGQNVSGTGDSLRVGSGTTSGTTGDLGFSEPTGIALGSNYSGAGAYHLGGGAEYIILKGTSAADEDSVAAYLANKFGLPA